jgi:hypothetical protein
MLRNPLRSSTCFTLSNGNFNGRGTLRYGFEDSNPLCQVVEFRAMDGRRRRSTVVASNVYLLRNMGDNVGHQTSRSSLENDDKNGSCLGAGLGFDRHYHVSHLLLIND